MLTNKKLLNKISIQKGIFPIDIAFTPEEADRFLDYIIDESMLKNNARIVRMAKESKLIRAIGLGAGRMLYPAEIFTSADYKKSLTHNKIPLAVKKARGAAVVYDDDLEDNIEGDAFADHLLKMIAAQIANELEEAYYNGAAVPSGTDPKDLLDVWNGWRHRVINSQVGGAYHNAVSGAAKILDARADFTLNNGYIAEKQADPPYEYEWKFAKMIKNLPSKYKKGGLANLRFFLSDQMVQDYIDALAARSTVLGDQVILGKGPLQYGTIPLIPVPLMPTNLPVEATDTHGDTTVDADSAAGQKVLNVAATTNFTVGDYVHIFKAGLEYKAEVGEIAFIEDGVSLTLVDDLEWAHIGTDAETVKESTLDGTDCMLTHRENLIVGLHRILKMESKREPADEATYFFYSLRSDLAIENVNAIVFLKNGKIR